jgi:SAM-dependent methyltransferase
MDQEYKSLIKDYYEDKFIKHGATSNGVDWNDDESHSHRIQNLVSHISPDCYDSILDFGCGYGKMYEILENIGSKLDYFGYDINEKAIQSATEINNGGHFFSKLEEQKSFDHVVANGIFNVSMNISKGGWKKYCYNTIDEMLSLSNKSVCFNMLTNYVDYEREHLCYFDPKEIFDRYINKNDTCITIKHFNKMYEFIVLIEKQ